MYFIFDYEYKINSEEITLLVRKKNGEEWELDIENQYQDLGLTFLALGIRAPQAAQGAALEKHDGAHTGSVIHVVFLDIENPCFPFDHGAVVPVVFESLGLSS